MATAPTCSRRNQLLVELAEATRKYFKLMGKLSGLQDGPEYSKFLESALEQFKDCQHASTALRQHVSEHRCKDERFQL
jgi:hypothetical protein